MISKITRCFFLIVLFFSNFIWAQTYFQKVDSLRNFGKLEEAIVEYKKLIKEESFSDKLAYEYAEVLSLKNQVDSAFYYLELSTQKDSSYYPLKNKFFYNLTSDKRWESFTNRQLEKYQSKKGNFKDLDYAKKLIGLGQKDQLYFYEIYLSERLHGHDAPITKALWDLKERINEQLLAEMEELIKEKGYPKCSENMPCSIPFLIIQHSELDTQEKYINLLRNLCDKHQIPCNHYAMLKDRINLRKGIPQIYGTQYKRDKNGKYKLYNLLEPEQVNERRAKLGLAPLK